LRRADLLRRLVRVEITHPGIKLNVFARIVVEQFAGLLSMPFVQFTSKYSYATTVAALARSMVQRNPLRAECVRRIATGTGIESSPNVMRAARQDCQECSAKLISRFQADQMDCGKTGIRLAPVLQWRPAVSPYMIAATSLQLRK
jgi:hypothetical protein